MHHIVFLDRASIVADIRAPQAAHVWIDHEQTRHEEVVPRLRDADIAVVNKVTLDAAVLAQLPRLRMIALCATGSDRIDLAYCRAHDIRVSNIRDYATHTVPEHVFMLMLALRRNLQGYATDVRTGAWTRAEQFCLFTHPLHDLHGSTLGIVGSGSLGQAVARLGAAFGMRVLHAERRAAVSVRAGFTPFTEVLARADVLSLHVPLTAETRALIGAAELAQMKRTALLINCARGGVVDETALADALRKGVIAGAGVDVLTQEPPPASHPLLAADVPNLIITPHIAWASREAMQTVADQLVDNIDAFIAGAPRNVLT